MVQFFVGCGVLVLWSVIVGAIAPRIPARVFARKACTVGPTEARLVERIGIRRWKRHLPDAGGWFSRDGRKDAHIRNDSSALSRFVIESRRAELVHWASLAIVPTFFVWCPIPVALLLVLAGIAANLPCLMAVRYNRRRVVLLLDRRRALADPRDGG